MSEYCATRFGLHALSPPSLEISARTVESASQKAKGPGRTQSEEARTSATPVFHLGRAFLGSTRAMGLPNPLSALPHVLAAALARLRGGERDSRECSETDAFSPVKHHDDASRLADAPDGHRGEDPEDATRVHEETRVIPPARDAEARCVDGTGDRRGGVEDRTTENARTTVRTSHDVSRDENDASPSSPRPCEGASGVPWDALPEACVHRVLLHAGFRAALCAGATCTSWRRVLDSPHFWKTSFASHFGQEDARFFEPDDRRRFPPAGALPPANATSRSDGPRHDWRGAFAEETRAQKRWATGRCVAVSALRGGDRTEAAARAATRAHFDRQTDRQTDARVAGVAARRGACLVARADGRTSAFDLATGLETRVWRGETGAPCVCFAHCEASGLCVAGDADGRLAAYDVARGERVWFHTDNTDTRPTAVAVGAGVVVVGFADGTTRAFELASGRRLRARGATMASAVTCAAVDDATGWVAAAAGADVATWPIQLDGNGNGNGNDGVTWLVGHEEPVRCLRFATAAGRGGGGGGEGRGASAAASFTADASARARPETRRARPALLTAGDDATTRAWDASSGACVLELEGPPGTTEAEHAGQVPVEWTYTPPPGITALDTWCGLVVEGRADGSVLVWTGALEGIARAMRDLDEEEAVRAAPSPSRERRDESAKKTKTDAKERARSPSRDASSSNPKPQNLEMVTGDGSGSGRLVDDDSVFRDTIEAFPSREDRGRGDRGDDDEKKKKAKKAPRLRVARRLRRRTAGGGRTAIA